MGSRPLDGPQNCFFKVQDQHYSAPFIRYFDEAGEVQHTPNHVRADDRTGRSNGLIASRGYAFKRLAFGVRQHTAAVMQVEKILCHTITLRPRGGARTNLGLTQIALGKSFRALVKKQMRKPDATSIGQGSGALKG